jgi:hypothetical protein
MATNRTGPWFLTASGRQFFPADPQPEDVCVQDIAHALSHVCRFGGHCRSLYVVAQHAVLVSRLVAPEHALLALHHDDSEAYLGDMIRPLKMLMPDYKRVESRVEHVIDRALGITVRYGTCTGHDSPWGTGQCAVCLAKRSAHAAVKHADWTALATERRDLVIPSAWPWDIDEQGYAPHDGVIVPWTPHEARVLYLKRHVELGGTL